MPSLPNHKTQRVVRLAVFQVRLSVPFQVAVARPSQFVMESTFSKSSVIEMVRVGVSIQELAAAMRSVRRCHSIGP